MIGEVWIEYSIGADTLAIGSVGEQWKPSDEGTSAAIEVEDFEEAIERSERGASAVRCGAIRDAGLSHGRGAGSGRQQNHHPQIETREREGRMLMIKEVAFVAIAVSDAERARKFYQETLELKPGTTAMEGAWVEYDLARRRSVSAVIPAWQPSRDGTTVAFEVDDIDATIAKLKERGVTFDMEKTGDAGLLDGAVSRSGRQQAARAQTEDLH